MLSKSIQLANSYPIIMYVICFLFVLYHVSYSFVSYIILFHIEANCLLFIAVASHTFPYHYVLYCIVKYQQYCIMS